MAKMELTPHSNWKKLLLFSVVTFGGTCLTLFAVLSAMGYFAGTGFVYEKFDQWVKIYLYLSVSIITTSIQIIAQLFKFNNKFQKDANIKKESGDSLLRYIESAFEQERWTEVVKIGVSLSEALWYTGKFSLRIKIGGLLEESARHCNNMFVRSLALLDDLGWSMYRMNKTHGVSEIKRGLAIAEENNFSYLIAKGHRHLCHIEADAGKIDVALDHYYIAINSISKIEDKAKQQEMRGNVEYAHAKIYKAESQFDKALDAIAISIAQYRLNNDKDREVKMYNFKGEMHLRNGDKELALESFQVGYELAVEISNNVNIVSNAISIATIYKEQDLIAKAIKVLQSVNKYLYRMTDPVVSIHYAALQKSLREQENGKE
jgi:tetratricopeptide (TPR) repeat protein